MYSAIRLVPQMDKDTTVRVLNENFTLLENYTDLYLKTGVFEFKETSLNSFEFKNQSGKIKHNGNTELRFSSFIEAFPWTNGGTIPAILEDHVVAGNWGVSTYKEVSGTVVAVMTYFIGADKDYIYFFRECFNPTGNPQTAPSSKIWYFIEREPV